MISQQWIAVQCYLIIFQGACLTVQDPGNCTQRNSFSIKCCPGYFQNENKCKECEPGFIGENCSLTCPPRHYGRQCREMCDCSQSMYCEPTRGCVCNTTSVNCTDPVHESTREMTIYSTSMQSVKHLFSMQNIAISTVRNNRPEIGEQNSNDEIYNHVNLRVQHSDHSIYNTSSTADAGDSASSFGLTTALLLQQPQSVESIQNKWRLHDERFDESTVNEPHVKTVDNKTTGGQADIYSTPCKRMTKKLIYRYSEQGQQRNGNETVTFEYPNSIIDTVVHVPESRTKLISPRKWTQDEEIYANTDDLAYTNNSIRPDSPLESDVSEEYFDVSYEGQLTV